MFTRIASVLAGLVIGATAFTVSPALADKGDLPPPQTDTFDFQQLYEACDSAAYRLEVRVMRKDNRIDRLQARVERLRDRLDARR